MMKGAAHTLEAIISIAIITVSIAFIYRLPSVYIGEDISIMKEQGIYALEYMDLYYNLRWLAANGDEDEIERILEELLPSGVSLEAEICRIECNTVGVPKSANVVSVDYYVTTYIDEYNGYKIRLWMWR